MRSRLLGTSVPSLPSFPYNQSHPQMCKSQKFAPEVVQDNAKQGRRGKHSYEEESPKF